MDKRSAFFKKFEGCYLSITLSEMKVLNKALKEIQEKIIEDRIYDYIIVIQNGVIAYDSVRVFNLVSHLCKREISSRELLEFLQEDGTYIEI